MQNDLVLARNRNEMPSGQMTEVPSSTVGEMRQGSGMLGTTTGAGEVIRRMPLGSMNAIANTGILTGMPSGQMTESSTLATTGMTLSAMPTGAMARTASFPVRGQLQSEIDSLKRQLDWRE